MDIYIHIGQREKNLNVQMPTFFFRHIVNLDIFAWIHFRETEKSGRRFCVNTYMYVIMNMGLCVILYVFLSCLIVGILNKQEVRKNYSARNKIHSQYMYIYMYIIKLGTT